MLPTAQITYFLDFPAIINCNPTNWTHKHTFLNLFLVRYLVLVMKKHFMLEFIYCKFGGVLFTWVSLMARKSIPKST